MFCTRVAWICLVCLLLCKEEGSSQLLRGGIWALCVACLTVFVNCLVKHILLLNVMEVLSVGGGDLLDRPCMVFPIMCVMCL